VPWEVWLVSWRVGDYESKYWTGKKQGIVKVMHVCM
jgi:hypothetical protein